MRRRTTIEFHDHLAHTHIYMGSSVIYWTQHVPEAIFRKYPLGVTHKYKNQKKSEISDLGGEGGGEGVRRAENF